MIAKYKIPAIIFCLALILNSVFILMPDDALDRFILLRILGCLDLPGIALYMLISGDIHGAQQGPVGQGLQALVISLGTTVFWWMIYKLVVRIRTAIKSRSEKNKSTIN